MVQTNLAGVALDVFSSSGVTLTREGLEQLLKTLRDIRCNFEPSSLEEHVQEFCLMSKRATVSLYPSPSPNKKNLFFQSHRCGLDECGGLLSHENRRSGFLFIIWSRPAWELPKTILHKTSSATGIHLAATYNHTTTLKLHKGAFMHHPPCLSASSRSTSQTSSSTSTPLQQSRRSPSFKRAARFHPSPSR